MKVIPEPLTYILRCHQDDEAVFGDPFFASCILTIDQDGIGDLRALVSTQPFTPDMHRGLMREAKRLGAKRVRFTRRKGDRVLSMLAGD